MLNQILSQNPPTMPDVSWWQDYGPLGIIALIVASGIITYAWFIHFPYMRASQKQDLKHRERKQELENLRDEKLNVFIDQLSESHSLEVEYKRQIADAVTNIAKTQAAHAQHCATTMNAVEGIEQLLRNKHRPA